MKIRSGLIEIFMRHPVAANLLMLLMLLGGIVGLLKMNIQFLPNFDINIITIEVPWPGASADDVEKGIIYPLERELRSVDNIKRIEAQARQNLGFLLIEFNDGADMTKASDQVRDAVDEVTSFPPDSEKPIITRIEKDEKIASILIHGPEHLRELRVIAWRAERELLDAGISKVEVIGLPQEEISIEFTPDMLTQLQRSLPQMAQLIAQESQDIPAGLLGRANVGQNLRAVEKKRSIQAFEQMRIPVNDGRSVLLGNISNIHLDLAEDEPRLLYQGNPAVELRLFRTNQDNALEMAKIAHEWLKNSRIKMGKGLHLSMFDESWILIQQRIDTLLYNGLSGLVLIIIILFIFLNRSVAYWVSLGIPVSVMAAMFILYAVGGSINMVSLFAMILTLGIIVDDTIVIGEESLTNLSIHEQPDYAILDACSKMLPPIASSSLTTISAFLPLMMIGGIIGTILFSIPLVVISMIIASIVECFLVLPGHLYHSALRKDVLKQSALRQRMDKFILNFRQRKFKPMLRKALIFYHPLILVSTLGMIGLVLALFLGGHLKFTFFPSPEGNVIKANVQFTAGTSEIKRIRFLQLLQQKGQEIADKLAKKEELSSPVEIIFATLNQIDVDETSKKIGEQYATVFLELLSGDKREFTNQRMMREWQTAVPLPDYVDSLAFTSPRGGPPGKDIDVQVNGTDIEDIKNALVAINAALFRIPGVMGIEDTLPYAQEQVIFSLNARGKALGLKTEDIGRQIRASLHGEIVQTFNDPNEEVEVKVRLEKAIRENRGLLARLLVKTPQNTLIPLTEVIDLQYRQLPEIIIHNDYRLSANIRAEVDASIANANEILNNLGSTLLPKLARKYNVNFSFEGQARDQEETLEDIKIGMITALILIYIVLAWVFRSYIMPVIVMAAIPLGLIGAMIGHWIMGLDLTLLSIFGLFGLSGIIINDSIILINEYQLLRQQRMGVLSAIVEASSSRLRAIFLTSITTIAGLTPLLFEQSLQAQFLIPMACSITFGLAFGTVLLLIVVPVLLMYLEYFRIGKKT